MEGILLMQFCTYCNEEFTNLIEHCDSKEHKENVQKDIPERGE